MSLASPSPTCTVNTLSTYPNGRDVTAASTVTIALADTAGVKQWGIVCLNTDDLLVAATITAGLTINTVAKTATFTAPPLGSALMFQSVVNNGRDSNGAPDPSLTTTFGVYVRTASNWRTAAFDEKTEGSAAYGWITKFNDVVRNGLVALASAGNGLLFGAGAYSVKPDPDGSIAVTASGVKVGVLASDAQHGTRGGGSTHAQVTGSTNGFMRAADKTTFDAATSAATASALAKRDASGNCSFAAVTCSGITNSGNASHAGTLGVGGATTCAGLSCTTLAASGAATVGGTLGVTGAVTMNSTCAVTGTASFSGAVLLQVTGQVIRGCPETLSGNSAYRNIRNIVGTNSDSSYDGRQFDILTVAVTTTARTYTLTALGASDRVRITIERFTNALASNGNLVVNNQAGINIAIMANLQGSVDCFWTGTTWVVVSKTSNVT